MGAQRGTRCLSQDRSLARFAVDRFPEKSRSLGIQRYAPRSAGFAVMDRQVVLGHVRNRESHNPASRSAS